MAMRTYLLRKPWLTLGDDFVINNTDDDGEAVSFNVTQKILSLRQTYFMEDGEGNEVYKIMERNVPNHRVCIYDADGERVAVVRKRADGVYWAHVDDDRDLFVTGDLNAGGVLVSNVGGLNVARLTEAWLFSVTDMFQMDIRADQDDPLILATMIAVQYLVEDDGDDDDDDADSIPLFALFANAFLLRKAWLTIGDDFVVNSIGGGGEDVHFNVTQRLLRLRRTYEVSDADGEQVYTIQERNRPRHRVMIMDPDGGKVAVVRKRGDGSYWAHVDGDRDIFCSGDAAEGSLEMANIGGLGIAKLESASRLEHIFPNAPDMFSVLIRQDQEDSLIIAVAIAVQYLAEDEEGDDEEDGDDDDEEGEEEGGDDEPAIGGGRLLGRAFRRRG